MFTPKVTESLSRLEPVSADAFARDAARMPRFEPVPERPCSGRSQRCLVTASLVLSRREDGRTGRKER